MAEEENEQPYFESKSLTSLTSWALGMTGPLAAVQRSLELQERILGPVRALERSGLLARHEALAQVARATEPLAGMRTAVSAVSQLARVSQQIERSMLPVASIKALPPSFDKAIIAQATAGARLAALGAGMETPMVRLAMARSSFDESKVAGIMKALDKTALVAAAQHRSMIASIGQSLGPGWAATLKRHEMVGASVLARVAEVGRGLDMARLDGHMKHMNQLSNMVRPVRASLALHQVNHVVHSLNKVSWLGRDIADAMAISASAIDAMRDEVALDEEKARLAETFARSSAGLILPSGPSTLRDPEEASGLLDMLGRSPYHWVRTGAGLLVALTKSYITYTTTPFADADELAGEVARDGRLHDFVTTHLEPYGADRVEAFRDGTMLYVNGRPFSAIPILINHLEGVLATAAINAGYLIPDPKNAGKPRFKKTGNPIGGADDAIKGLAAMGILTPEETEYLVRHVYGGRGNAFRHGQPLVYDPIQAARLILGFYVITERTRDVA